MATLCSIAVLAGCGGSSDDDGEEGQPAATTPTQTTSGTDPDITAREEEVHDCAEKIDGIRVEYTSDWDSDGGVVFVADRLKGSMVLLLYSDQKAATARLDEMHSFYDNIQSRESEVIARQGDIDPEVLAQITACL